MTTDSDARRERYQRAPDPREEDGIKDTGRDPEADADREVPGE